MSLREWIESLGDQIDDTLRSISECWFELKSSVGAALKHPQFHAWLGVIAAVASAVATGFSYFAADRSADVSSKALMFTERKNQEQIALARPVLSVMNGRLISWDEGEKLSPKMMYRLELVIRNSGGRSALPAWIGLFKKDTVVGRQLLVDWNLQPIAVQISEVPSSAEGKIVFDLGNLESVPSDWMLGLAYGDDVPNVSRKGDALPEQRLQKECSSAKVIWLHASKSPEVVVSGPSEMVVTSATPMVVDLKNASINGPTEFEAVAVQMNRTLEADGRCAAHM